MSFGCADKYYKSNVRIHIQNRIEDKKIAYREHKYWGINRM